MEKHIFDPFLTHFLVPKQPIFKAFCDFGVAKMACHGLKKDSFHLFRHPKWSRIIFGKTHFCPIFDSFLVAKQPIFMAFWDFRGAKTGHHDLKLCQKHLFWHSMWSRVTFEKKSFFFQPVDLVDPFWHPPLWATSCSLPQPNGPRYGGLGVG